jgi:Carboxypeptidase regulatory-like domain
MNFELRMARAGKVVSLLGAIVCMLLFSITLFSQGNFGRILGAVTDQTGGVVSNATVTIIDKDRGPARTLTTDDAGEYNAPTLLPGTYIVRVEANGFKRLERQNVVLEVGKEIRVDLTVQPGEQTQSVTVTEAIPLVETTNATLGGTLNNADINDLPLNGRNYQSLLALRPGVMLQPGGGPWTQSTNGVRPDESAWMVDGVINVNFYDARPIAGMSSPISDGATILPIDAIQEFNLEENPKAEYGWKPGAVVNVGVKSGTNNLHGTAYAFGRSDAFNARNIFNPAQVNGTCLLNPQVPAVCNKTASELEQFGATVGGPIKKDKLFFFGGYEGLRSNISNAFGTTAPETASQATASKPAGDPKNSMVDAILALQGKGIAVSPVSLGLVGCPSGPLTTASTCTGGLFQGASANSTFFNSTFPNLNTSDNGIGKLDYRINNKHELNGLLFIGNYGGTGEDHPLVNANFRNTIPIRTWSIVTNWIWTPNSRWVNDARFGYDRTSFTFVAGDVNTPADGKGYPLNSGVTATGGLPNINFGSTNGPLFAALGSWRGRPFGFGPNPYYDVQDNVSYLLGKHSFKFGGEYAHIESDWNLQDRGRIDFLGKQTPGFVNSLGKANSTILEDFFAGNPARGFLLVPGTPVRTVNWISTAGFIQDDYRLTQKLIINLGLRYEYKSPMKEVNNLLGSFDPAKGLVQQGQAGLDTVWRPDHKNFSPRIGFAWDVTGKGTTVVRAGGSIMYSSFFEAMILSQPGLQDTSPATNLASVPTGACNMPVSVGKTCSGVGGQTFGGTLVLASTQIPAGSLNWNGNSPSAPLFTASGVPSCTSPLTPGGKPCPIMAVDPNLRTPYITAWNLGVTHAFNSNLSLEVGYVGNHGARLVGFRDINQAPLGAGYCLNALTAAQIADACAGGPIPVANGADANAENEARPFFTKFPYLNFINQLSNQAHSNYNSLQTTLTERTSHGLSFIAGYTYGHGLDNGSLNRFGLLPQDSSNIATEYGSSDFDVRHRFTFTTSYALPGRKGFGQLLEGWKLNGIVTLQSPQRWTISDTNNDFSGSGDTADRWNFFGNPNDFKSGSSSIPFCSGFGGTVTCTQSSGIDASVTQLPASLGAKCTAVAPDPNTLAVAGCYVVGNSVLVPAKLGTFGTMGRNLFPDGGFKNVDFSIFKIFTFTERYSAQFRFEVFNLFNTPTIANPYGASNGYKNGYDPSGALFGCGCTTPDIAAGSPIVSSGDNRVMQLGLKFAF